MVVGTTIQSALMNVPSDVIPVYASANSSAAAGTTASSAVFAAAEAGGIVGYVMGGVYYSSRTLAISIMGAITLLVGIIQALYCCGNFR